MNTINNLKIELDTVLALNPAAQGIFAHVVINDRLWIAGETRTGFATWEVGQDNSSNNGHYELTDGKAAVDDMIKRAWGTV